MYTENAPILSLTPEDLHIKVYSYMLARADAKARRANGYPDEDVRTIFGYHLDFAPPVGMNALVAVAQTIHETGGLTSFWSARPRRNGSGYGKSGNSTHTDPSDPVRWCEVLPGYFEEGCSFPSWSISVQAQVGRLLAYAIPITNLTPEQSTLVDLADSYRAITPPIFNSANTIKQLGAIHNKANIGLPRNRWKAGWAWSGEKYGRSIAQIMNEIISR